GAFNYLERTESANGHLIAVCKSTLDRLKNGVDSFGAGRFALICRFGNGSYKILFTHNHFSSTQPGSSSKNPGFLDTKRPNSLLMLRQHTPKPDIHAKNPTQIAVRIILTLRDVGALPQ